MDHIGGRQVLSPLRHPCTQMQWIVNIQYFVLGGMINWRTVACASEQRSALVTPNFAGWSAAAWVVWFH